MRSKTYKMTFAVVVGVLTAIFIVATAAAQPPENNGRRPDRQRGRIRERIRAADTNGDGSISAEEAKKAGWPERLVRALDADADGTITREDLAGRTGNRYGEGDRRRGADRDLPGISDELARALAKADSDRNGFVSRKEFRQATPGTPQKLFDRLDADKDGKLARAELARVSRLPRQDNRPDPNPLRRLRELITSFNEIDVDKNGELSIAELRARKVKLPVDGLKRLDADRNAAISRSELRTAAEMAGRAARGEGVGRRKSRGSGEGQRLAKADSNGDGRITRNEFRKAIPHAPVEAFDRIDADKNGVVTKDELAGIQRRFREGRNRQFGRRGRGQQYRRGERRGRYQERDRPGPQTRNRPSRRKYR